MAYFSNGTEGEDYTAKYCDNCEHRPEDENDGDCPIWGAHFLYAYEEHGKPGGEILDMLIPMVDHTFKDGIVGKVAGECRFFERRQPRLPL